MMADNNKDKNPDTYVSYQIRADTSELSADLETGKVMVEKSVKDTVEAEGKAEKQAVDASKKRQKEKTKAVEKANDEIEKDSEKTQKSITDTAEKQNDKTVKSHKESTGKINQQSEKTSDKIINQVKQAAQKIKKSSKDTADDAVDQSKKAEKEIGDSAEGMASSVAGAVGKAVAAIGGISAAVAGVKSAIESVTNLDSGTNQIAAALGLTPEEAEKYRGIIKDIYADNFGESFDDIGNTISLIKQQMRDIGDDDLKGATEAAYMLSDVYEMGVSESIRGASSMMKQFGISSEEAFNLLAQGAEKGLNQNGDLADQMAEYSTYYSQMGFSAEDAMNMALSAAEKGVYQIDKVNDAMKEFSIRAIDGSETTREGFELLGLDADKLAADFAKGGDKAKEAFDVVINSLADCDDAVQRNLAGVNLFGTQWEDAGETAILSLANVGGEIDNTRDKLTEMGEVKYDDLGSQLETLKRKLELMMQPLGEQLIPIIIDIVEELTPIVESLIPSLMDFVPVIGDVIKALLPIISEVLKFIVEFKDILGPLAIGLGAAKVAMTLFNAACDANPVLILVGAIGALTGWIISLATETVECSAEVQALSDSMQALNEKTENAIADAEAECQMLMNKEERYEYLRQKIDLTAAEEAELKGLAEELQGVLGNNCQVIDDATGKYNNLSAAVQDYCNKKMQEIKLTAYEEEAKDAYKKQAELQKQWDEANERAGQKAKEIDAKVDEFNNGAFAIPFYGSYLQYDIKDKNNELAQAQADRAEIERMMAEAQEDIDRYEKMYSESLVNSAPQQEKQEPDDEEEQSNDDDKDSPYDYYPIVEEPVSYTPKTTTAVEPVSYTPVQTTRTAAPVTVTAPTAAPTVSPNNSGKTINITSYIPTVWDDAEKANQKLIAGGLAASLVGNSRSGKLIEGLSSTAGVSTKSETAEATLSDVVKGINSLNLTVKALQQSQESLDYTVTAILKCDSVTLAKQTIKGIKTIEKSTGKSPL